MMAFRNGDAPGRYSSEAVSAKVHGDVASRRCHGSHDCGDAIGRFSVAAPTRGQQRGFVFRARDAIDIDIGCLSRYMRRGGGRLTEIDLTHFDYAIETLRVCYSGRDAAARYIRSAQIRSSREPRLECYRTRWRRAGERGGC